MTVALRKTTIYTPLWPVLTVFAGKYFVAVHCAIHFQLTQRNDFSMVLNKRLRLQYLRVALVTMSHLAGYDGNLLNPFDGWRGENYSIYGEESVKKSEISIV